MGLWGSSFKDPNEISRVNIRHETVAVNDWKGERRRAGGRELGEGCVEGRRAG